MRRPLLLLLIMLLPLRVWAGAFMSTQMSAHWLRQQQLIELPSGLDQHHAATKAQQSHVMPGGCAMHEPKHLMPAEQHNQHALRQQSSGGTTVATAAATATVTTAATTVVTTAAVHGQTSQADLSVAISAQDLSAADHSTQQEAEHGAEHDIPRSASLSADCQSCDLCAGLSSVPSVLLVAYWPMPSQRFNALTVGFQSADHPQALDPPR